MKTLTLKTLLIASLCCGLLSGCCGGGHSGYSRPAKKPAKDEGYKFELNINTSELEYCRRSGLARYCLD